MPRKGTKNHQHSSSEWVMSDQGHIFEQLMRPQIEDMSDDMMHEPETSVEHPVSDESSESQELV